MKRHFIIGLFVCLGSMVAWGQTPDSLIQDTLQSVNRLMELREVVVKGNLPNTRLKGNAMITRIQGTPLATSGSLGEMLVKVPGMTGSEDAPEVLGKGSPLIYINGRLMRDDSELKRLRSEDIRDVEVINNPGAQYDATVRAVVRIRTVKQQGEGLSLDLSLTDEQDLRYGFNRPYGKLGANYRKGGVDVFGSVYYFHQDYRQYSSLTDTTHSTRTIIQTGPYTMTWKNDQLTYTAGMNWQISDLHSVGVRADLTHFLGGTNQVIYDEDVLTDGVLSEHLYSVQTSKETHPLGLLTNTYYNGKAGRLGIDFNFDFMTSGIDTDRDNVEKQRAGGADDFVFSKSGADSRLYATKLVLSYPVWKGKLEAGKEMTFARRHNTYWIDLPTIANTDADIKEDNIAAFAEYRRDFGKFGNASVGMRYEHTLYDYDDVKNSDYLHRSMDEWFPTASYSVALGKVQTGLSYSIKTNRPSFFAMNDAVTYISRYSMQAGNSQLLNERLRDLTLNASWKWITFTASYERCKNPITQWSYIVDGDAALIKHINLERPINTLSAYVSVTPRWGIWSLNASAGVDKQDLYLDIPVVADLQSASAESTISNPLQPVGSIASPVEERRIYCDKPVFTVNAYNTFTLKYDWRFDVNIQFLSRGHSQNFYNDYDKFRVGVVAQKSLLRDKSLTLRLAVFDIFQRNRMNEYADMGYYQIRQNNRFSTHKLSFSLVYRLNATRSKYKGTGAGVEAQERMKN